jgi:hypothetical protein
MLATLHHHGVHFRLSTSPVIQPNRYYKKKTLHPPNSSLSFSSPHQNVTSKHGADQKRPGFLATLTKKEGKEGL